MNPAIGHSGKNLYEFGAFCLDPAERILLQAGKRVPLVPKAIETLLILVQHSGHVLTKDELIKALWPNTFVEENNLTQHISALRRALGEGHDGNVYIETVPRLGYRFVKDVRVLPAEESDLLLARRSRTYIVIREEEEEQITATEEGALWGRTDAEALTSRSGSSDLGPASAVMGSAARADKTAAGPFSNRRVRIKLLVFSSTCLALAAVLVFWVVTGRWRDRLFKGISRPAITSLAVLPLQNLSNDAAQEYFVDGMTDALITELARIRPLRVISRTSVMSYKGTRKPLPQIARELNVDAVVEGTVMRSGDRIRITAQLVEGATDRHLWAEKYERSLGDVLALQGEVAEAICREVQVSLDPEQVQKKGPRHIDPEAYELYAKARFLWNRQSPGDLQKAEKFFQGALEKEPGWAPVYAGLADVYNFLVDPRASEEAKRALELDETLAEAHNSLALTLELRWEQAGAEREFRRAIELNPNYSTAHQMYAFFLSANGRHEEALTEATRAQQLDPISLYVSETLGDILFFARRYDAAVERYRKTLEMDPHFPMAHRDVGDVYLQKRMYRDAIAEFEAARAASTPGADLLASLGQAYGLTGQRAKAQQVVTSLSERAKQNADAWYFAAPVYLGLSEKNRALECLEKAYATHSFALMSLKMDPRLDDLRADPRFQDLVRRVGLPL